MTMFTVERFFRLLGILKDSKGAELGAMAYRMPEGPESEKERVKLRTALIRLQQANRKLFREPLSVGHLWWAAKRSVEQENSDYEALLCAARSLPIEEQCGGGWLGTTEILVDRERGESYYLFNGFMF